MMSEAFMAGLLLMAGASRSSDRSAGLLVEWKLSGDAYREH
jgi:hypothetical protein